MHSKNLVDKIKSIVHGNNLYEISSLKDLLKAGADPVSKVNSESAYDIVKQNNESGEFNAIIEEFDLHMQSDLREVDSIDEGMKLKDEELS